MALLHRIQAVLLLALLAVALLSPSADAISLKRSGSCRNVLLFFHRNAQSRLSQFAPAPRGSLSPSSAAGPTASSPTFAKAPQPTLTNGVDFSGTNVQVAGVDEPDIVKTDGKRVFVVRSRTLFSIQVTSGGKGGRVVGKLNLEKAPSEMLFERDHLLLIARDYGELNPKLTPIPHPPIFRNPTLLPGSPLATSSRLSLRPFFGRPITVLYRISIRTNRPRLLHTLRMHGRYISAREVNGIARIVTSFQPNFYPYYYRGAPQTSALLPSRLDVWLPKYRLTSHCGSKCESIRTGFVTSCNDVFFPNGEFSGFGVLTVTTVSLRAAPVPTGSVSIVSDGDKIYATQRSLYVATTVYQRDFPSDIARIGSSFRTSLHKFRLWTNSASYVGSGAVQGSVLNQFSMHEYAGTFFVATTEGSPWWRGRNLSKSKITAFVPGIGALNEIGSVGNLGLGERIYAVRYLGDVAYVVTFRQIDPLYIIDISRPSNMEVTGELKIPGFSSYLHPIGNGKLLGVGREATPEGRTTGAKVSLFDVSDVTRPVELDAWTLKGSYTSAQFDHRAFLFWAPEQTAVMPLSVSSRVDTERFAGSVVLKVVGNRIVEQGRISHPKCCGKYARQPSIQRNFVLGKVCLWSLSSKRLQVNGISDLMYKSAVALDY